MKPYERWQYKKIAERLEFMRVVVISGSRQCGKTTLAQSVVSQNAKYVTFDDELALEAAHSDPKGFVQHNDGTMIIDEIQRSPRLVLAIKLDVDNNPQPGRFLLTGSANILALPSIPDSLAGRASYIRLRPLTQGEIMGNQPTFIERALNNDFAGFSSSFTKKDLIEIAFAGGFPTALKLNAAKRKIWHTDYVKTLIERDLKDIATIRKISTLPDLLKILAAWSSKYLDISSIANTLEISRPTVSDYIDTLKLMYAVEEVNHWRKSDYEYASKQSKFFMTDTGLMSSLLDWHTDDVYYNSDKCGKLMETFAFNQLAAQMEASNQGCQLYHYRDQKKREIDFLLEYPNDKIVGIEIKAGTNVSPNDFQHMRWFKENIAKKRPFTGIVLHTGSRTFTLGDNLWAVPLGVLFE